MSRKEVPNLAAMIGTPKARLKVVTRHIPEPGPNELLVRNYAIAANPGDWKMQDYTLFVEKFPNVLGTDVCGVIIETGSLVTQFKNGDRVAGFAAVIYNQEIDHGAWQTYTLLRDLATLKIPDSMLFENGAIFPTAFATAGMGLFVDLGIPRPTGTPSKFSAVSHESGLLIWGASSCVGSAAVQIASTLGLKIFATASPKHHSWIKSLGATVVFDYHDSDVVEKIIEAASTEGTPIKFAFDSISEGDTLDLCPAVMKSYDGTDGKLAIVLPWLEEKSKPSGVEISMTLAYRHGTDQTEFGAWFFNEWLEKAVETGTVIACPEIELVEGGIAQAQNVLDMLKSGVSGKKLVLEVK